MKNFKKRYLEMRNDGKYDLQFFFEYYLSKGGLIKDGNEFTEYFMYTHENMQTPPGYPPIRVRAGEVDRKSVLNFLDGVFGITILSDKEGNLIKAIG